MECSSAPLAYLRLLTVAELAQCSCTPSAESGSRFAPVCHNIGVNSEAPRLTLPPLKLGNLTVDTPVVLAPMAGVTNKAFRRLCSEYGGGLYVTEMVTARALVERKPESMRIIEHDRTRRSAPSRFTVWTRLTSVRLCAWSLKRTVPTTLT